MTYTIELVSIGEWLYQANVIVFDEAGNEVLNGHTKVASETEAEAYEYVDKTFLVDMRNNYPRILSTLKLDWEQEEVIV